MNTKIPRRQLILEALAGELENSPGNRITTAALARAAGVSEAALYRHFASKARMFEGLIDFAEENIFSRINRIMDEEAGAVRRCERVLYLLLGFAARNPGITRVLMGDALIGETERLHARVQQFFARIETQLRQILRESVLREGVSVDAQGVEARANLLMAVAEGRLHQFLRSRFEVTPLQHWDTQWPMLALNLFPSVPTEA
jgi:TetR/AcrR family transcriptional regulator